MHLSDFEALNERMVAQGSEPYVNPRNSASGFLRATRLPRDSREAPRPLGVRHPHGPRCAINFGPRGRTCSTGGRGFKTPERVELVATVEEIFDYHERYGADRDDLDYEIDGVVIKLDHLDARADLGSTSPPPSLGPRL